MADRSSAYLFGRVFKLIAEHVPEGAGRDELAAEFWREQRDYDFSPYQMNVDETLSSLGLARRGVDPDWPDDGEVWLYGPKDESEK